MLEDACVEIEVLTEKDRQERAHKYARRNRMRYIDQLLNELEMLNLADQAKMPDRAVRRRRPADRGDPRGGDPGRPQRGDRA